jgi:hypothetical protein
MVVKKVLNNRIEYYNDKEELHRTDGPAVEYNSGGKWWYVNGRYHREDGPAIEYGDGDKFWYINGLRHREDGPAVEWNDGKKEWYLNSTRYYTEQEWQQEVIKIKLNRLKNYVI